MREFFDPNLWPNTPDILHRIPAGWRTGRAFAIRLVLAATLGANYGIYGPAFELLANTPLATGQAKNTWIRKNMKSGTGTRNRPDSLKDLIARVNRIRRENPALQTNRNLPFHPVENEQLICYSKNTDDLSNYRLTVVNLDPHHTQSGWLRLAARGAWSSIRRVRIRCTTC